MAAIQVKNVPAELHEALRLRASAEGRTVSDYVLDLLRRDLSVPSQREWLDRLAARPVLEADDILATLDEIRHQRDEELNARGRH